MTKLFATYLTKNRLGIYYFQYRIPSKVLLSHNQIQDKHLFRKSLRTRVFSEALSLSRYLWVIMNTLNKKYFSNPVLYGKAMELLMRYEAVELSNWIDAEAFLEELDPTDTELLELALKQRKIDSKGKDIQLETMKSLMSQFEDHRQSPANQENKNNPKLSKLVSDWLSIKKPMLASSSYQTMEPRIRLFERVLYEIAGKTELLIGEITTDLIREYKELLEKLPAKRSGERFKDKSMKELVSMKVEKISSKTYLYNLDTTKQFINWVKLEGYLINDRLEGVLQVARKNTTATAKRQRVPFSDVDLKKIFENERYSDCKLERASEYWVPLISLFTGARLGEVCQFLVNDIVKIENVWCFKITETGDDDKRLKAKGSERTVPIHHQLINMGLISYKDAVSRRGNKLFPDEVRDYSGRFSAFQKRFNYYIKSLELDLHGSETKGFHSFRHLVRTKLVELNANEGLIDDIVGHTSNDRSIGSKFYTHTQLITQKNEAVQKLRYGINFSKIRNWKDFRFARFL